MKTELVSKEIFERELEMCRKLSGENGGKCNWGVCKNCGVIPLLYKLHKRILLENKEEIEKIKKEVLLYKGY